ncbi:MAG: M16 family metallopeptidase [Burkholderiales bacterium]
MRSKFLIAVFAGVAAVLAAVPAWAQLPIQSWQTKSGAKVVFVEARGLPMLDLSVDFAAGAAYDTREKAGLAAFTQGMLRAGAGKLSEDDISRRMADVGAQFGGRLDTDRAGLTLRTLTSQPELEQALAVFIATLQQPTFPADVLARDQTRTIGAIREALTKPETILSRTLYPLMYGTHPYGFPASGDPETVAALTREDLLTFYRRHYTARRATVAIIGDLSRAQAEAIAERVTAGLPPGEGVGVIPVVTPPGAGVTRAIPHPASQSHVALGMPVLKRDDPDYFPLFVGNYVLGGGGFASRISDEVRQKRGLAYSAYSYFSPLQQAGPFMLGLQTRKDQADEALAVVRSTLDRFVKDGPTEDELTRAKQNIIGGFPLRIDSNRKIHEYLAVIGFYNLPLTYLADFVAAVERTTTAQIRDAFTRRVDPARLVTVVVGTDTPKAAAAR